MRIELAVVGLLAASAVLAQERFANVVIEAEPVTDAVQLLTGAGGNMALVVGDDKAFLVDDQYVELGPRIAAKIAALTDKPLAFVVNTHWHSDHSGGNAHLAGDGALIIAHDNVRQRMSTRQFNQTFGRETKPSPAAALPVVTFTRDLTVHLGTLPVEITHVPGAHTDGDAVVYLPSENVLHTGDIFFNTLYPFIDGDSGGSVRGMIAGVSLLLDEIVNADTKIIPGHGPLASRDDLRAYRDFLATVADAIDAHISEGRTLEETIAARPTADFDATFNANGFFKPEQWVSLVYRDLSRSR